MKQILLILLFISGAATATALADLCSAPFDGDAWKTATPDSIACVDVNARNASGQTPLHYAAKYSQNFDVILALIERGADASVTDKKGNKLEHFLRSNSNPAIFQSMVDICRTNPEVECMRKGLSLGKYGDIMSERERKKHAAHKQHAAKRARLLRGARR